MKVNFTVFKPSGKYYTEDSIEVPDGTFAWDFHKVLNGKWAKFVVVTSGETPWGYPQMVPAQSKEEP